MKTLLLTTLSFVLLSSCKVKAQNTEKLFSVDSLRKTQALLTNEVSFSQNRNMFGASAFVANVNKSKYVITAKHLLGEWGGINPEIDAKYLDKNLIYWKLYPRNPVNSATDTILANAKNLIYPDSLKDILLLNITNKNYNIKSLDISTNIPLEKDSLYIVGCPYAEIDCKQNVYKAHFIEYDTTKRLIICMTDSKFSISGFSGAPLLNDKGYVIGVIISGGEMNGINYILATHIKEIEKIIGQPLITKNE